MSDVRLTVSGTELPGRDCGRFRDLHVGLQIGNHPVELVPGDAPEARWQVEIDVVDDGTGPDFRGRAVHGARGERFLYLTWGSWDGRTFGMFRRAKLMLGDSPITATTAEATATIRLTDERGMPRCARVQPPAVSWEVSDAGH